MIVNPVNVVIDTKLEKWITNLASKLIVDFAGLINDIPQYESSPNLAHTQHYILPRSRKLSKISSGFCESYHESFWSVVIKPTYSWVLFHANFLFLWWGILEIGTLSTFG
jgi:hypothetical protein